MLPSLALLCYSSLSFVALFSYLPLYLTSISLTLLSPRLSIPLVLSLHLYPCLPSASIHSLSLFVAFKHTLILVPIVFS